MNDFKRTIEVLITGANGFIGGKLCSRMSDSYKVAALDIKKDINFSGKYQFFECDLVDSSQLKNQINILPKTVIHCAGLAHQKVGTFDREDYVKVNSYATENLAQVTANCNNMLHFIFFSTISVYGETDLVQPVSENSAYNPSSDYAFSKLDAEKRLIDLYEKGVIHKLTILRLAPVYDSEFRLNLERRILGPKKIVYVIFGNGQQTMSALARPNLVDFIEYIVKTQDDERRIEIMNVSDQNPYSFSGIIQTFKKNNIYKYKPTISVPLPMVWLLTRLAGSIFGKQKLWFHSCYEKVASSLVFDNTRMLQTGFKPKHNLKTIFNPQISQIDADSKKNKR